MNMRFFRSFLAVLLLVVMLPLAGCEDRFTVDNFSKIKAGMSMSEVETIMGGKGELETSMGGGISAGGITTTSVVTSSTYKWQNGTKLITVTMHDGKVIQPNKSGF